MQTSKRPRADGVEARARILDSAEALFAESGFHGTSVRDITEQAAVLLASVIALRAAESQGWRSYLALVHTCGKR